LINKTAPAEKERKMALKKYKPITAGTRWRIGNAYAEITTNQPEKSLLEPQKQTVKSVISLHLREFR